MIHNMFYDMEQGRFIPRDKLAELGLPDDEELLISLAFYPVEFALPETTDPQTGKTQIRTYDPESQGIEPDGNPEFSEAQPTLLIQKMRVVNLLDKFKAVKRQELAAKRWEKQSAGFILSDGTQIPTSPDDFSRILAVQQSMSADKVLLKLPTGWAEYEQERLREIIVLAGGYIESCYAYERRLAGAIDIVSSIAALNSIEIDSGWPDNREGTR